MTGSVFRRFFTTMCTTAFGLVHNNEFHLEVRSLRLDTVTRISRGALMVHWMLRLKACVMIIALSTSSTCRNRLFTFMLLLQGSSESGSINLQCFYLHRFPNLRSSIYSGVDQKTVIQKKQCSGSLQFRRWTHRRDLVIEQSRQKVCGGD